MKKLLLLLLLSVLAVSCNRPLRPASQTSNPDSQNGWQTYTNAQYGFQFKYPPTWSVAQATDPHIIFTFKTQQGYDANFGIDSFDPYTFDQGRKSAIEQTGLSRSVMIGSESGLIDVGVNCSGGVSCDAFFQFLSNQLTSKGFAFFATIVTDKNESQIADPYPLFQKEMQEVERALSTFQFTDDWQTYTDNDHGFQFRYEQGSDSFVASDGRPTGLIFSVKKDGVETLYTKLSHLTQMIPNSCPQITERIGTLTVAGITGEKCSTTPSGWTANIQRTVSSGIDVYNFTCSYEHDDFKSYCDNVLSTFKFIK